MIDRIIREKKGFITGSNRYDNDDPEIVLLLYLIESFDYTNNN
jgi:hypothetical protein